MKKIDRCWLIILITLSVQVIAGDLSSDIRKGASDPRAGDGNYVEIAVGMNAIRSPYYGIPQGARTGETKYGGSIDLNIHLQYNKWFMEGFSQSLEQFTLGYNVTNGARWSLDAVALQQHEEISKDVSRDLKGINRRESDFMSGIRATGYYENYIVQLHALTDISDTHNGQVLSLKLARRWQYKNWNFHAIQSESYRTRRVVDYYLSVQPNNATEKFPEFQAQAGFTHTFEIGATYPLSQKWVFRTLLRHIELQSQWNGSPLIVSGHGDLFLNSFSYVF